MACDCIEVMDAKLAEHNTRLVRMFCTKQGPEIGWYDTVSLEIEKIVPRNRDRMRALPTFCPFCGIRYVPDKSSPTTDATAAQRADGMGEGT